MKKHGLKITFILPYAGTAGGTRVVAQYADRLQKRGHKVVVISTPRRDPGIKTKLKNAIKGKGWHKPTGPSHLDHVKVDHRVLNEWRPMTDADVPDADVVIATWWETAEWVAKFSPSKGKKIYFIQHDESTFAEPRDRIDKTWLLPMKKITIAKWLVDLAKVRGDEDVALVPNAVDLDQFTAAPRGKQKNFTVGLMYSQAHFKGTDIAIEAFEEAAKNIPRIEMVAFGTQDPDRKLLLPTDAKYFKNPPQTQIKDIYAACDAWLFSSRTEGFGLPILEAMACRTPVIATPSGAAPELVGQGGGILVKPEDPLDMARAIERIGLMKDPQWRELSDKAYETATKYTWEDATTLFEKALLKFRENG
jgi:glycosyltransferase involved in cell wall biosynthesis